MISIYILIENNLPVYIGKTNEPNRRLKEHKVNFSKDISLEVIDEVEERKSQLNEIFKNRMLEIEKLVLPLLYNLMKNPDKEYILWPNRTESLNKQIVIIKPGVLQFIYNPGIKITLICKPRVTNKVLDA